MNALVTINSSIVGNPKTTPSVVATSSHLRRVLPPVRSVQDVEYACARRSALATHLTLGKANGPFLHLRAVTFEVGQKPERWFVTLWTISF
jgi:hypothetical protein